MKVSDLAAATNLSIGMLSKVENGGISPSLTTLQAIANGLAIPITWLVSRFESESAAVFVKASSDVVRQPRTPWVRLAPADFVLKPA